MKKIKVHISGFLGAATLLQLFGWAQAGITPFCANCVVAERQKALRPSVSVLTPTSSDNLTEGWNVATVLNHPDPSKQASALQFPVMPQAPQLPAGQTWWTGQGDLPGSFNPSWSLPATNFDPSFISPYYTTQQGVLNVTSAPWSYAPAPGWWGGNWPTLGTQFQNPSNQPFWTLTGTENVPSYSLFGRPSGLGMKDSI